MYFRKTVPSYLVFIFLNPLHDCANVMTCQASWLQEKAYQYRCSQTMLFHTHLHYSWWTVNGGSCVTAVSCVVFFWSSPHSYTQTKGGVISVDGPSRAPQNIPWLKGLRHFAVKLPALWEVLNILTWTFGGL